VSSKTTVPEKKVLATICATAAKQGENRLSMREIDSEIRAERRKRVLAQ
jgi:hypothetical protein